MPVEPPSIFPNCPSSLTPQTLTTTPRAVKARGISIEDRRAIPDELTEFLLVDQIASFQHLSDSCKTHFPSHIVHESDHPSTIKIFDISNSFPPSVTFSVVIHSNLSVLAFHDIHKVRIKDLLGFPYTLCKWSQLEAIVNRAKHFELEDINEENTFLLNQISLDKKTPTTRRYNSETVHAALQIFLSSRSAYRALTSYLHLPTPITLKKYLGKYCDVGSLDECTATIRSVFDKVNEGQRRGILLFDEIYVKPSVRYRGGHLIGYSIDNPTHLAKTMLAIMFKPFFGGSSFVCRILPVSSLSPSFVVEHLTQVTHVITENGGSVVCFMSDNHPTNRSAFNSFRKDQETDPYICHLPIDSSDRIFMLNDPVHLFKCIRNNWFTEKSRTMTINFRGRVYTGKWNDIIKIYEGEKLNVVNRAGLTFEAVYPGPVDRQKVHLMAKVFDDKIVAALRHSNFSETANFLDLFIRCWKMLNIKDKKASIKLNDSDRQPFYSIEDDRLDFLLDVASGVSKMSGSKGYSRHLSLTSETRNAFVNTLKGWLLL